MKVGSYENTTRNTVFSVHPSCGACITAGRLQVEGKHTCTDTLRSGVKEHVGVSVSSRAKHTQPSPRGSLLPDGSSRVS